MNYNDVFLRCALLDSIPLGDDTFDFPTDVVTDVILLRVGYKQKKQEFEDTMRSVVGSLKRDGFDERDAAVRHMESVDKRIADGEDVPEDERKRADETRLTLDDFRKEESQLIDAYKQARLKKADEEVSMATEKMEYATFRGIVDTIGQHGTVNVVGIPNVSEMVKSQFLTAICANLVRI